MDQTELLRSEAGRASVEAGSPQKMIKEASKASDRVTYMCSDLRLQSPGRIRTDDLSLTRRLLSVGLDGSRPIRRIVWMIIGMIKAHPTQNRMPRRAARVRPPNPSQESGCGGSASPLGCSGVALAGRVRPRGRGWPAATSRATSVSFRPEDRAARRRWVKASWSSRRSRSIRAPLARSIRPRESRGVWSWSARRR
jgi:hypothetical protein